MLGKSSLVLSSYLWSISRNWYLSHQLKKTPMKWATKKNQTTKQQLQRKSWAWTSIIKSRTFESFCHCLGFAAAEVNSLKEEWVDSQFSNSWMPGTLFSHWTDASAWGFVIPAFNSLWQSSLCLENSFGFPTPWTGVILPEFFISIYIKRCLLWRSLLWMLYLRDSPKAPFIVDKRGNG